MARAELVGRCAMIPERYTCVCVKEFSAQALLRLRPELRERACVVMQGEPPLQTVCSLNRQARQAGLTHGMTLVEVETFPQAVILQRSAEEEATAKAVLLECAGGFSPRVEACAGDGVFLCVLDIAGTERLLGAADMLAHDLLSRMQRLGFAACAAISDNFHTAVTAAKGLTARNPVRVIAAGAERESLAPQPLAVLDLTAEQAETFALWGIRTLGALAELPEKELISRMGQEGKRLLQLSRGERLHLFQPVEPEFTLTESMDLDTPVEAFDALLFVVNLLLEQIVLRAAARVLALASVSITLSLEGGATHERTVSPALPSNDRQMWLKLLHLDLEAHSPQAAVLAVRIAAEPGRVSKVQLGLFSPQLPEPARLDVTLARLKALVGEENVGAPVLNDSHAPEAFHMEPFKVVSSPAAQRAQAQTRVAQRCVRPAESISVTLRDDRPATFSFRGHLCAVERAYGPWLTSGNWWKPTLWGCEQWDLVARAQDGSMLCCCVVRDVLHDQWEMTALYD